MAEYWHSMVRNPFAPLTITIKQSTTNPIRENNSQKKLVYPINHSIPGPYLQSYIMLPHKKMYMY